MLWVYGFRYNLLVRALARVPRGKLIPAALFLLVILSLALPIVGVSCNGILGSRHLSAYSGLQLVVGRSPTIEEIACKGNASPLMQEVEPNPFALLVLGFALAGILANIFLQQRGQRLGLSLGVLGAGTLLLGMRPHFDSVAQESGIGHEAAAPPQGVSYLDFREGYWLALVLFLAVILWHVVLMARPARATLD